MNSYVYVTLLLSLHSCYWKYGFSEKRVRHGDCIDDLLSRLPQESFRASSVRQSESNQFQPYQVWLKKIWDNNEQSLAEAWCPSELVHSNKESYLEIIFPSLHLVSTILTKGRRMGNVEEFTPGYILEYQREDGDTWFTYQMQNGTHILSANSDSYNHVRRTLEGPIIAKRVRLYPISQDGKRREVCLKLKLFGCPFDDGVVEYRAPVGFTGFDDILTIRGGKIYDFVDRTYDTRSKSCRVTQRDNVSPHSKETTLCWLHGGMGILMDDQIYNGGSPLSFSIDNDANKYFVGWKITEESPTVKLIFRFQAVHEIHSLMLYVVNYPDLEIASFQRLAARATMTDICADMDSSNPHERIEENPDPNQWIVEQMPDERMTGARWVSIQQNSSPTSAQRTSVIGRYLCVELVPFKRFLLLGEVVLNATRKVLTFEEEKTMVDGELAEVERRKRPVIETTTMKTTWKPTTKLQGDLGSPTDMVTESVIDNSNNITTAVQSIQKGSLFSGFHVIAVIMVLFILCLLTFAMLILRCNLASRCCGKHCCSRIHSRRCASFPPNCRQHCYSAGAVNYTDHYINDMRMSPKCGTQKWIDYIPSPSHCTTSSYPLVRSNAESPVNMQSAYFYPSPGGKLNPVSCPPMYSIHPDSTSYLPAVGYYPSPNPNVMHFSNAAPAGQYNPLPYMNASTYLFAPPHSVTQFTDDNRTVSSQTPTYIAACSTLTDDSNASHVYELANTVSSQLQQQGRDHEMSESRCSAMHSPRPSVSLTSYVSPSNSSARNENKAPRDVEDEPLASASALSTDKVMWNSAPGSSANSSSGRGSFEISQAARTSLSEYVNEPSPSTSSGTFRPPLPPNHPSTQGPFQHNQDSTTTLISPYAVQGLITEKSGTLALAPTSPPSKKVNGVNGSLSPQNNCSKSQLSRQRSKGRDMVTNKTQ